MRMKPHEEIRAAAYALVRDGLEVEELLPSGFHLETLGFQVSVNGPCLHKYDDHMVKGIAIGLWSIHSASVIVRPFEELEERIVFEYMDPAFPQNLFDYVAHNICSWMCWWDTFREEGQLEGLEDLLL